ncbi:MAG: cation-translocating P-type ATPase C-terminal domain-containing protein, partial [Acidimicrobiia bacterium]|nr:cation-translocating P-type ATPase C-terminal domain-containing protein [Acidimicrobiia bacterium]
LMDRPPREIGQRIIDGPMQRGIGLIGLTMAIVALGMLDLKLPGGLLGGPYWGDGDLVTARTGAFTVLVLVQLVNTLNARSDVDSIRGQVLINRVLLGAVAVSLGLQIAVVYVPWFHAPFGTAPLGPVDWLVACLLALSVLVVGELRKLFLRRRPPT